MDIGLLDNGLLDIGLLDYLNKLLVLLDIGFDELLVDYIISFIGYWWMFIF